MRQANAAMHRGKGHAMAPGFLRTVHAPDFAEGLDWIGVGRPLTLSDLRGKIALIDFWTAG
jgi:hypothetical protein